MRFDTSQHMRLGQHMKLAPRMIQSMEILQMPLMQLEERIAQELESNVTLEQVEGGEGEDGRDSGEIAEGAASAALREAGEGPSASDHDQRLDLDGKSNADDFDRLETFERDNPDYSENAYSEPTSSTNEFDRAERTRSSRLDGEPDAKAEAMANTATRGQSLLEQLQDQWRLADVEPELAALGAHVIGFIEEDGYLRTPIATMLDRLSSGETASAQQAERALEAVQLLLEPPGVAARDTRECLLLQVDARLEQIGRSGGGGSAAEIEAERGNWRLVRRLIADHLEDLAQNRLPRVAERAGVELAVLNRAIERMRQLSLAPARQLVTERVEVIVPDAIVEYDVDADRYVCYLNDSRLPNLRINKEYAAMSKDKLAPKPTREFIKKNLSNSLWLLDAIEQRRRTLLRVLQVVVGAQREYFDFGPQALKPLPMTQVAEQLGIHVATVSRAVADKHVLTPRGVVALRGFFSGGTKNEAGEDVSWDAIKAALKDVIDAEDKSAPLSDDALAEALSSRGIEIARRTVAKYRDQLKIAPARLRKQFTGQCGG
jgi:RNA polymerase sigma-54 factor